MKNILKITALGALLTPVAVVAGVTLKSNSNIHSYENSGKQAWKSAVERFAKKQATTNNKPESFVDFIPKDDDTVSFILQRHALSPLTESLSYALLSAGDTYIDSVYDEYDYSKLNDVNTGNTKIHISDSGLGSMNIPPEWIKIAQDAKDNGKKINVVMPIDRFAEDQLILKRANPILSIADNIIALEDGKSNLTGGSGSNLAKALIALENGAIPPKNTLLGFGKWLETGGFEDKRGTYINSGSYEGFGYSDPNLDTAKGNQAYIAVNYLPNVHAMFTGAKETIANKVNGRTFEDYGIGDIDQMQLQAALFNHGSNMSITDPKTPRKFVALRNFFSAATLKQIKSSIDDSKKQYLMLGTYTSGYPNLQAGDNFKDTFVKFYERLHKDGYQLFWKGHPNGDAEGEWIKNEFMENGYTPTGANDKVTYNKADNDLIVLPPEADVESYYDLRDATDVTSTAEFSWDAIGVVQWGVIPTKTTSIQLTSGLKNPTIYANWDKFDDVLFLGSAPDGKGASVLTDAHDHWKIITDPKTSAITGYDPDYIV